MKICMELFKDGLRKRLRQIMGILYIEDEKNNSQVIEKLLKPILMEFFVNIFESEKYSQKFFTKIVERYTYFVKEIEHFNNRQGEFEDLIKSSSFKNLIAKVKRIIVFAEFHDPTLHIKIDILEDNNVELRTFKSTECICIDGLVKENKNYLVLLSPPLLKNCYPYQGLKPVVIMYDIKPEEIRTILGTYISEKPKFLTENQGETSEDMNEFSFEEKKLKQSLSNFELKTVSIDNLNANAVKSAFNSFKANNSTKKCFPSKNKTDVFGGEIPLAPSVDDSGEFIIHPDEDNDILVVESIESKVVNKNTFGNKFINHNVSTPNKKSYFNVNPKKNDMIRTKTMDNMLKGKEASKGGFKPNHTVNTQQLVQRSTSHNDIKEGTNKAPLKDFNSQRTLKAEKLIQSSRSNYESDESSQAGNEFQVPEIARGHHSIYNSFTVNKKGELSSHTLCGFNRMNTDKKAETNKHLFHQTAEIKDVNIASPVFHSQYITGNRNISITPKQNKPKITDAYSPRSNIGYYLNDRLTGLKDTQMGSRDTSMSKEAVAGLLNSDEKQIKKRKHNSYITVVPNGKPIDGSSYNKSLLGNNQINLKNRSVDRRIFENKTNAQTKISVSELLSFKKNDKGRIVNTNTTFGTNGNKTKSSFINIKYV
jgi:hypothetical protein